MTRVNVISSDSDFADVLVGAGHSVVGVDPAKLELGLEAVLHLDGQWPAVVVVDGRAGAESAVDLARTVAQAGLSVVLVAKHESGLLLEALRAGVREVVEPDVFETELAAAVTRVHVSHPLGAGEAGAPASAGRAIAVISAKGGVGKSTIAANLSLGLAALAVHDVVLVDLDSQFGDAASLLDLAPSSSVLDAAQSLAQADTMLLKTFLTPHPQGLLVLAGSPSPTAADRIDAEHARDVVNALKTVFGTVVVDTSAGITEQSLGALEAADEIVLVTSMDLSSVRAAAKVLEILGQLGLSTIPVRVVLNGQERKSGLLVKDIEKVIGRSVDVTLPRSDAALLAGNRGAPLILGKQDAWVKAFKGLVRHYAAGLKPLEAAAVGKGKK